MRRRVLVVVAMSIIGAIAAAVGVERYASTTVDQRIAHAHEAVSAELERLADVHDRAPMRDPRGVGRRNFQTLKSGMLRESLQDAGAQPMGQVVVDARSAIARESRAKGEPIVREIANPIGAPVVVGVMALPDGTYAWAATIVAPTSGIEMRTIVLTVVLVSFVVVAISVVTLVQFERGGRSLIGSLEGLASNLRAPVPRPPLSELGDVADGIARLAETLDASNVRMAAMERAAMLGRVSAGVAHEVRNPLAAIKLKTDLALEQAGLDPTLARDLRDISSEVERLDRFVRDLLVISRERAASRSPLDFGGLLRRRAELMDPWARTRSVEFEIEGEAEGSADPDGLARAVDNLLRNAVEAAPAGSKVRVRIVRSGEAVVIDVLDGGAGVPEARLAQLFEPFFTTKSDGTGLGLALATAIASAHGGGLAYRREGDATCFTLTIRE